MYFSSRALSADFVQRPSLLLSGTSDEVIRNKFGLLNDRLSYSYMCAGVVFKFKIKMIGMLELH